MLKGIDPRLNADVLYALCAMGHGDAVALVDMNFPAASVSRCTVVGKVLQMENLSSAEATEAVLSVMPLDTFVQDFALRMEVVGNPDELPALQRDVQTTIDRAEGKPRPMQGIERFAFYQAAQQCYAVIQTGERGFYGCFILRKGVIAPDA